MEKTQDIPTKTIEFQFICMEKSFFILFHFPSSLLSTLRDRHECVTSEISSLEGVDKTAQDLAAKLKRLQKEISAVDVWHKDSHENANKKLEVK